MSGLTEASTSFDLEHVKPFLERLSSHVDGFGQAQIDPLAEEIALLPIDEEKSWDFDVAYQGQEVPLHVRAFMDDNEAPDVYFFSTPELAELIQQEIRAYFDELGY